MQIGQSTLSSSFWYKTTYGQGRLAVASRPKFQYLALALQLQTLTLETWALGLELET